MIISRESVVTPLRYLPVGGKFFYPTYRESSVEQSLMDEAYSLGIRVTVRTGIKDGLYGILVTRIA